MRLSVVIPSRNERYLQQTINDLLAKAAGEIEVIAVLDGYWPDPPIADHPKVTLIHRTDAHGMRDAINSAASIAKGKFLMKTDAHCLFGQGFDDVLCADCEDNWVVIPRRVSLDGENWGILNNGKAPVDYHYLSYPYFKPEEIGMHGNVWIDRAKERADILIDDEMSTQGSCWFMRKRHFDKFLGGMNERNYGRFVQEAQEIGLKTWLGGGRMVVNKKTFYAHWHKGKTVGRGYFISKKEMINGAHWSADYWMNNRWDKRIHDLEWLIDKFAPVPTWPTNWKELPREPQRT